MDGGFLASMQCDAIPGQIADLTRSFQTDNVHLGGSGFEYHRHFRADDTGNAYRSAHAKMRIGLDERGCLGTHTAVI